MAAALVNMSAAQPTSVVSWVIEKDDFDAHPWVVRLCHCFACHMFPNKVSMARESYSADYAALPGWNVHHFAGHITIGTFIIGLLYAAELEGHCIAVAVFYLSVIEHVLQLCLTWTMSCPVLESVGWALLECVPGCVCRPVRCVTADGADILKVPKGVHAVSCSHTLSEASAQPPRRAY